jgi:hypothetical protein
MTTTHELTNQTTKVNPGSMAARDPWRPGRMRPRPDHARVVVSTGDGVDPPRHLASTWKPTYPWLRTSRHWTKPLPINAYVVEHRDGIMLFDTGQDRASVTDPGNFPGGATESSTTASPRASTSAPAIRSPPGWRPSAGCRSSNAARGHGSRARPLRDPAPTGVPVAAGRTACATTGEREAPPRSRLARTRPSAGGGGPSAWSVPPTTGAGAATGAPLAGGVSLAGAPRGCASPGRCTF